MQNPWVEPLLDLGSFELPALPVPWTVYAVAVSLQAGPLIPALVVVPHLAHDLAPNLLREAAQLFEEEGALDDLASIRTPPALRRRDGTLPGAWSVGAAWDNAQTLIARVTTEVEHKGEDAGLALAAQRHPWLLLVDPLSAILRRRLGLGPAVAPSEVALAGLRSGLPGRAGRPPGLPPVELTLYSDLRELAALGGVGNIASAMTDAHREQRAEAFLGSTRQELRDRLRGIQRRLKQAGLFEVAIPFPNDPLPSGDLSAGLIRWAASAAREAPLRVVCADRWEGFRALPLPSPALDGEQEWPAWAPRSPAC